MIKGQNLVLIVDDDLAVRESLKFSLELDGLTVHTCGSGTELLEHPDLLRAQCLVVDYKMPVMNGFEVLERLIARNMQPQVILITSHATETLRRRAAAAGIRHVLEKPLLDSALLDRIKDILSDPL